MELYWFYMMWLFIKGLEMNKELLASKYVDVTAIPNELVIKEPVHQDYTLTDGKLVPWQGARKEVYSGIHILENGSPKQVYLGSIPETGLVEADAALVAAEKAFDNGLGAWPRMRVSERIQCVQNFTNQILAKRTEIVRLLMWEIGKSLADSEKEFDRTIEYIRATIDELKKLDNSNSRFEIVDGTIAQIRRSPLGVVLCMGPYNYPMNETFTTLLPALIMGNVVLFKPPRMGVLLFQPMLEAFCNSFPAGVINVIYGRGSVVVPHIMSTGKVNVIALIGSSRIADQLKKAHPKTNRLRAVLGLDAKNAGIVMDDADLDLAVKECLTGALSFNGQRCTALKMLLVHRKIVDVFLEKLSKAVEEVSIGMPWTKGVFITPLPEQEKISYMRECIADAEAQGARIVNPSGGIVSGTLMFPAVMYPVKEGMKLYREEQFGPIIPVRAFDDIDEALEYVITSDHGQQVSIFGTNPETIAGLVDVLVNQVCRVNINCQCQRGPDVFPFVGRKDSAEGTLSVHDALRAFSIRTMVAAKQTELSKKILDSIVINNFSAFINTHFIF